MAKETRNRLQIKIAGLKRLVMWHYLKSRLGCVLVSEFPKSGASWFCQMLSEASGLPYPRNRAPKFEPCILHGHYPYHSDFGKMICIMRDGRDVMVSAYYHFLFENDKNPAYNVNFYRARMPFTDVENVEKNLPAFIEFLFTKYTIKNKPTSWKTFVDEYYENPKIHIVKYEDLLADSATELEKTLKFIGAKIPQRAHLQTIADKFSFKNLTKRKPGEENTSSFLRKGIAGDWKNKFSPEACKMFDKYAGKELIKMGYEKDNSWVHEAQFV